MLTSWLYSSGNKRRLSKYLMLTALVVPVPIPAQLSQDFLLRPGHNSSEAKAVQDFTLTQIAPYHDRFVEWKACLAAIAGPMIASNVPGDLSINRALEGCQAYEENLKASIASKIGLTRASQVVTLAREFEIYEAAKRYGGTKPLAKGDLRVSDWRISHSGNFCFAIFDSLNSRGNPSKAVLLQGNKGIGLGMATIAEPISRSFWPDRKERLFRTKITNRYKVVFDGPRDFFLLSGSDPEEVFTMLDPEFIEKIRGDVVYIELVDVKQAVFLADVDQAINAMSTCVSKYVK